MKLTVIGNGNVVPTKESNPSAFLIQTSGKMILLDCGYGAVRRLIDAGFDLQKIDIVFVSHFHPDHFADVMPLVISRFVDDMELKRNHRPLVVIGPAGLKNSWQAYRKISWPEPEDKYPIVFKEDLVKIRAQGINIATFNVKHAPWFKSAGIIIWATNKKLVYTGDISGNHKLNDLAKVACKSDLLICESSHANGKMLTHFTLDQIEDLERQADIKKYLITHVNPTQRALVKKRIAKNPNFMLAELGMQITI